MGEYTLPFVGNVPTTIVLDDEARQYELKNIHIGLLPSFNGRVTEDCLQFMKQYGATLETFSAKNLRLKTASFVEEDGELFHEAWERFNLLLAQMPPHTYHPELKVNSFYSGFSPITQMMVDNACGGTIADKRAVEAYDILEKIA
ncbi:hypothetical protein LWI28_007270 [Acer negundo]|uniref:Uncharacterized protein n=1 Tax=Acer negundo TaxID=4023 RepID=A0AAD5JH15_ACENE|nr:hypothetical protein LWI28_007270 [Acer negundo]